ncbi:MAG: Hpt domain-containing protein [Desulfobacteraceae bacterium]|nr:MAG: Hpt domain-containing protein [Desulfobacteraceae bacterium]
MSDNKAQVSAVGTGKETVLLDLEAALERTMGDKEFLQELFQEFMQNAPTDIETIQSLISAKDADGVRRLAHRIKGSAANLSFLKVSAIALLLENAGRDNNLAISEGLLKELDAAIQETKTHISSLI